MSHYILTIKAPLKLQGIIVERWDVSAFTKWVAAQNEKIGGNFQARLEQFRRYTGSDVIDWEMED